MTAHVDLGHALRCALLGAKDATLRKILLDALDNYRPVVGDVVRVSGDDVNGFGMVTAVSGVKMQVRFNGTLHMFVKYQGGYRSGDLCADFRYENI